MLTILDKINDLFVFFVGYADCEVMLSFVFVDIYLVFLFLIYSVEGLNLLFVEGETLIISLEF